MLEGRTVDVGWPVAEHDIGAATGPQMLLLACVPQLCRQRPGQVCFVCLRNYAEANSAN